jgi:hypothetical protein
MDHEHKLYMDAIKKAAIKDLMMILDEYPDLDLNLPDKVGLHLHLCPKILITWLIS